MRDMKKPIMITVAAFALAVAGCGADAEEESFKQDFNAAQAPLEKLLTDSAGASDPGLRWARSPTASRTPPTKMATLDAPEDAQDELDTFVKEVNASADIMREAQKAMEDQGPREDDRAS